MELRRIFAHLSCSDLTASIDWFSQLFDREPDSQPMSGLAEWEHRGGGLQLYEDPDAAGYGSLTLIVENLLREHRRLEETGLEPGEVEPGDYTSLVRLSDPDDNLVVLAQKGSV